VRAVLVVFLSPSLDYISGVFQGVVQIGIDTFLPEFSDEAFDASILPGTSRRDVEGLATLPGQPFLNIMSHQLGAIITAQMLGCTINLKQLI
jgi:hypothetical protein